MNTLLSWIQSILFPLRHPWTLFCFGCLLSVPSLLWPMMEHLQRITLDGPATVRLFLDENLSEQDGQALVRELIARTEISHARFIPRESAWEDFGETVRLAKELETAHLPDIILTELAAEAPMPETADMLRDLDGVRFVSAGGRWAQRFQALKQLGLVGGTVSLVIGVLLVYHMLSLHLLSRTPPVLSSGRCLMVGTLFGMIGALISFGLSSGIVSYLDPLFPDSYLFDSLDPALDWELGIPMGLLGAVLARRRFLRGTSRRNWHSN